MLLDFGLLIVGGVLLYFGADWFVHGAAGLAKAIGVSPLVIGLTVVSYGTSAPELAVSMLAAIDGKSDIALGNVVGSNIANIGLILGLTALIAPPRVDPSMARRELPLLLLFTAAVPLALLDGRIAQVDGVLLTLGALGFTYITLRWSRQMPDMPVPSDIPDEPPAQLNKLKLSLIALLGLGVLLAGGRVFVNGSVGIALAFGMSERVVGLTVVAIGTSLPELAASVVAALRGHSELAIGNVVGSNIFNIALILGLTSLLFPIPGALGEMRIDFGFMFATTLLCVVFLRKDRTISRAEGGVLLAVYVVFIGALLFMR